MIAAPKNSERDRREETLNLSIVIPAYNEEKLLPRTLQSVQAAAGAFTAAGWTFELIVCDNNSTDGTALLARAGGARVVFEPLNQIARARNTGARAATGEWLLFLDADSCPTQALFADVVATIRSGRCLAGGVTLVLDGDYPVAARIGRFWNWISRGFKLMAGSFIFVERAAFWVVGGFNEELFASEEIDLSRRLHRAARPLGKKVIILHRHPLVTSGRKIHLYSVREHLRFFVRTVLRGKRNLCSRAECPTWYDGRR